MQELLVNQRELLNFLQEISLAIFVFVYLYICRTGQLFFL